MPRKIDLTGQKFGRLRVVSESQRRDRSGSVQWNCLCECGAVAITSTQAMRSGHASSCGCLQKERMLAANTKHGGSRTPAYVSWHAMVRRCKSPKAINYSDYGGRGIQVCERWSDFRNFLADMGEPGHDESLDRIDTNGNYEPGNCRWANKETQQRNTRRQERQNLGIETLKHGKYRARIRGNGRLIDLGAHDTPSQARAARKRGEEIYWGA